MKTKNPDEIILFLKKVLVGAYYDSFTYRITHFEAVLQHDLLKIKANLILGEFELENKEKWEKWLEVYPVNIANLCGPKEPAKGLLITLLTQVPIKDIKGEKGGTLIIHFENDFKVRLMGDDKVTGLSWSLLFSNEEGEKIGRIYCSFNKMFLYIRENFLKELNNET